MNVTALPTVGASATQTTVCAGNSSTISGSGATSYTWNQGLGAGSSFSVSPSSTTTYTVTGTSSGCTNTASVTVNVNSLPSVAASATYPSICTGESTDISASGASTYNWSGLGSGATHTVSPTSTTTYTVTGTAANSCSATAQVTVTVASAPVVLASAANPVICLGSSTTINASGAANYSWDQGLGSGSTHLITPSATTTYTVTGSTGSGCSATTNVTVTVNPVPGDPIASATPMTICLGDSTVITASGGGTGLDYEVYTAPVGGTLLGDASLTVSPGTTTVYYVQAVNSYGCANTGGRVPVTVIVNPLPAAPIISASDTTICEGESAALLAGGSGTGVVYEVWSDSTAGSLLGYAPMMVTPSTTTTYFIQAVTAAGCGNAGGMVPFEITVNPVTDAAMNAAGPFCILDASVNLTALNSGGTWAGTGISNASLGTFDPSVAGNGNHQITYTTAGPCSDTDTMWILVTDVLDATINPAGPFCLYDGSVVLTAATSGGTWSGTGITNPVTGSFDPSVAGTGTHDIVYTTSGACGDTDTIQLVVADQMDASIGAAGPFCENEVVVLLSAADPGGSWSGPGILNAASGLFDPASATPGTHVIVYSIPGACGDSDSISLVVYETPQLSCTATDESCTGAGDGQITTDVSGGSSPYTYLWSNGSGTGNISALQAGQYIITVTDQNGCERTQTVQLDDPGIPCDGVDPHAVVPNAFSPNGDGENDVLYVRGEGVTQMTFYIYDRWGEKVFESFSLSTGWDGTFRGKELDPAVFSYFLNVIFADGTEKLEKGDITLIR